MEHVSERRMIQVKDDWHPCFEGNKICVTIQWFHFDGEREYTVLISAHGADDFGVELRHVSISKESATSIYEFWKKHIFNRIPNGITVEWFYEHGFIPG